MEGEELKAEVLNHPDVKPLLEGKTIRKVIAVKNIFNIVVS